MFFLWQSDKIHSLLHKRNLKLVFFRNFDFWCQILCQSFPHVVPQITWILNELTNQILFFHLRIFNCGTFFFRNFSWKKSIYFCQLGCDICHLMNRLFPHAGFQTSASSTIFLTFFVIHLPGVVVRQKYVLFPDKKTRKSSLVWYFEKSCEFEFFEGT